MNAYLVMGAESSGTRLMTRILITAGCFGDDGHEQRLDKSLSIANGQMLVWRRSFPHSGIWPDISRMVKRLEDAGYSTQAVVMCRAWWAMMPSQVRNGHVNNEAIALERIQQAYPNIYGQLEGLQLHYVVVPYEALAQYPMTTIRHMVDILRIEGINWDALGELSMQIVSQNYKYVEK